MSKILITGNGFDLFHGLPTKYGHFMAVMKTIEESNFKNEIVDFEELFGKIFKVEFPNDYNAIIERYNTNNISFDKSIIENFKTKLNENGWYNYFKSVNEIETWIDFENEIEKALEGISVVFNNVKNIPTSNFSFYDKYSLRVFCEFEHFNFSDNKSKDSSFFYFNDRFLDAKNMKIKEGMVLKSMYISLQEFTIIFNRFLVDIVDLFYKEFKQTNHIPFNLIDKIYTSNYTPTLEKIYKVDKSKIIYFHGEVNEDVSIQNLILGVSELPNKIKERKFYNFSKQFQKIYNHVNQEFLGFLKKSRNETIFYVIGHSLDKSDKDYILDLFKFLENDKYEKSKICVFYYDNIDRENKLNNLFNVVGEENVVRMNQQGRLFFIELNKNNIEREFNKQTFVYKPYV